MAAIATLLAVAGPARAQEPRAAVVTQVAGQNLYLDAGREAGLTAGDTVGVRRTALGPQVGLFAVIGATRTTAVVTYAGAPFPLTRGDTVYLGVRAPVAPAPVAAAARPAPVAARVTPSLTGAMGVEMAGTHTTTLGLGADPVTSSQDFATPALRLRADLDDPAGHRRLTVNLRAERRVGPTGLFDPATSIRLYDIHLDQGAGPARFTVGRFLSDFDHASGFWDGGALRVGRERGLSLGMAGGFEPVRTNEGFSTDLLKYAGFLNLRARAPGVRYDGGVSFTRRQPRGGGAVASILDVSQRLDAGVAHLSGEVEAAPSAGTLGAWTVTRLITRGMISAGPTFDLYATYVRDHPQPIDSVPGFVPVARERVAGGVSYRAGRTFMNLDASVNEPRDTARAYAFSAMAGLPTFVRGVTVSASASYFTGPWLHGILASPSVEYRHAGTRVRGSYQLYLSEGTVYSILTHGADLLVSRALAARVDWVARVNFRTGSNLRSSGAYTSLDVRF